ncbi:hypothetical protein B9Z65_6690 [Elsinoe australis]|uniref:NACHT domain-containing protein n=1 Tax=Elsinoe australis TaxID=40998 RepID=A0A2P8ADY9_9PEZI|nr:hypothetical protein B9Z65_6690 [Elsinoe australis]
MSSNSARDEDTAHRIYAFNNGASVSSQIGSQTFNNFNNINFTTRHKDHSETTAEVHEISSHLSLSQRQIEAFFSQDEQQRLKDVRIAVDHREVLLDSLYFSNMHRRRAMVDTAHEATFEWILKGPEDIDLQELGVDNEKLLVWHSFPEWLRSPENDQIYWINGKPGSGKSMLMRFIEANDKTVAILQCGDPLIKAHIASYYFWLAGTSPLQKTVEGALRSLLFQVIEQDSVNANQLRIPSGKSEWTKQLLLQTLQQALLQSEDRWLFLLDGLDESVNDIDDMKKLLRDLEKLTQVKLLVSSRPLRSLEIYFQNSPSLRVQDLTGNDVETYVRNRINESSAINDYLRPGELEALVGILAHRAEGVFLWVKFATNSIIDGVEHLETTDQLWSRLDVLPTNINEMFKKMFSRMSPQHRGEALFYFRLLLVAKKSGVDLTVFEASAAHLMDPDPDRTTKKRASILEILEHCEYVMINARSKCAGFLDVEPGVKGRTPILDFIHRTAYDFLLNHLASDMEAGGCESALRVLVEVHIELIRFAGDDLNILHALSNYNVITIFRYMEQLISFEPEDLLSLWQRLDESGSDFIQKLNVRLELTEGTGFWPKILQHLYSNYSEAWPRSSRFMQFEYLTGSTSNEVREKWHYSCAHASFFPNTSNGAAAAMFLIELVKSVLAGSNSSEATYLAYCCLKGFRFWNAHLEGEWGERIRRSEAHGAYLGMLTTCLDGGADARMSRNQVLKESMPVVYQWCRPEPDGTSSFALLEALLSSFEHIRNSDAEPTRSRIDEFLDMLKLLHLNGTDLKEPRMKIYLSDLVDSNRWQSQVFIECNHATHFCYLASHDIAWADLAHFIWAHDPTLLVSCLGFDDGHFNLRDHGMTAGLGLVDSGNVFGSMENFISVANLRRKTWCPYVPSEEALKKYECALRQSKALYVRMFAEVFDRLKTNELKLAVPWTGTWSKVYRLYSGLIEHKGTQWKWTYYTPSDPIMESPSRRTSKDSFETFYSAVSAGDAELVNR